jgi:hypothetical protein
MDMTKEKNTDSIREEIRSLTVRINAMIERNFEQSQIDQLAKTKMQLQKQLSVMP